MAGCGDTYTNNDVERARLERKPEYQYLSSEDTRPFVKGNADYNLSVIKEYPTVQSCLIPSEQTTNTPDLRLINWDKITTIPELEVCLWRIFSSLKYPEPVLEWLDFHKAVDSVLGRGVFEVYPESRFTNRKFNFTLDDQTRHGLGGGYFAAFGWSTAMPFKGGRRWRPAYFFNIGISFDKDNQVFSGVRCKWLHESF